MNQKLFRMFMLLFALLFSQWVLAQTVIRTPTPRPAGGDLAVDLEATRVITDWASTTGGALVHNGQYRIVWGNGTEVETFNLQRLMSGWLAQAVVGSRQQLVMNETTERFESGPKQYCETYTVTLEITTVWYMPSSGEIVDTSTRTESFQAGGC